VLKPNDAQRLSVDLADCFANISKISTATDLTQKLREVFGAYSEPQNTDPDLAIYSGGFFADADKASMTKIRFMSAEQLANSQFSFTDKRLTEMLFRYRARNYPDTLTAEEQQKWQTFCVNRLTGQQSGAGITFADYFARLNELKTDEKANQETIQALETYGLEKKQQLGMTAFA
jgi:exodeoxyribonuclease-1